MKYLGRHFDIHGGGLDLVFPHHENELVQSESYTGEPFASYWLHNGLLTKEGRKISKSDPGTIVLMSDLLKAHSPDTLRAALALEPLSPADRFRARPARRDRARAADVLPGVRAVHRADRRAVRPARGPAPPRRVRSRRLGTARRRSPSTASSSSTRWTTTSTPAAPSASCSRSSTPSIGSPTS